jgi:protein-S-isoprenylcysteine O-methyltransferase Ste14
MHEALRLYFLTFYVVGIVVLIISVLSASVPPTAVEKQPQGVLRYLPVILIPVNWMLPPSAIFLHLGEIGADWEALRVLGFLLSFYAAVMLLWASNALGRFLVPRAVVFHDHTLVTVGPYHFVRHPIYSGVLALWLGAALATLNLLLLLVWPAAMVGVSIQARLEEELLRAKFGPAYESYAQATGRLLPLFWS